MGTDDAVLAELEHLRSVAAERARFLEMTTAALNRVKAEADRREALIQELSQALTERDTRITDLRRVAEERLAVITTLDNTVRTLRGEAEKRTLLIAELTALVEEKERETARRRGASP